MTPGATLDRRLFLVKDAAPLSKDHATSSVACTLKKEKCDNET